MGWPRVPDSLFENLDLQDLLQHRQQLVHMRPQDEQALAAIRATVSNVTAEAPTAL